MVSVKDIAVKSKAGGKGTSAWSDIMTKDIRLFGPAFKDKQKEAFFAELHILISSGIDIISSLDLIVAGQKKEKDREFFTAVKNAVVNGRSLSAAIGSSPGFSSYEVNSVLIGEETGRLDFVLKEIASYYASKIRQRRQVVQALTYPGMVLSVAILAIFFMMKFIVPMFADVFKRFGGDLPAITKFTLAASAVIGSFFIYFSAALLVVWIILHRNRKKEWCRKLLSGILLRIPFLKDLLVKIYLIKLCRTMSLLLSSRIPLLNVLKLTKGMIAFYPIEISLEDVINALMKGEMLHKTLSRHSIYPMRFISLMKAGEETNQLDAMLVKIGDQYSEEVEHRMGILSSLIEPAMIIFLGVIVGFILIAMYLPLFQLSSTIR